MATHRKIAIAAGGTAGHVYPALAVADAYREIFPDAEIFFIGGSEGLESRLVAARGYRLEVIRSAPFAGQSARRKFRAIAGLVIGAVQARRLLKTRQVKLVIGFGGYASAGALIAARTLRRATAIHEANVAPGLANRWLGRSVDRVYLAFAETQSAFPRSRALLTGNPVRREIVSTRDRRRKNSARDVLNPRILVTGGSGGADFLNRRVPELLAKVAARGFALDVLHQAGRFAPESIRAGYAGTGIAASVVAYIDDMAEAYAWADFAIACAGAQTLSELRVCGLPCLLVPLSSAARDHQIDNAAAFAEAGNGWWVKPTDWQADALADRIAASLRGRESGGAPLDRGASPRELDAAEKIIADLEALMQGRW
jgi:UDP-N-acetylglucosamine--N-acetylmuramyl-(pentapeptide) pyrophosphoryl-undecaprenol N-acetylglucosamine transferase